MHLITDKTEIKIEIDKSTIILAILILLSTNQEKYRESYLGIDLNCI